MENHKDNTLYNFNSSHHYHFAMVYDWDSRALGDIHQFRDNIDAFIIILLSSGYSP